MATLGPIDRGGSWCCEVASAYKRRDDATVPATGLVACVLATPEPRLQCTVMESKTCAAVWCALGWGIAGRTATASLLRWSGRGWSRKEAGQQAYPDLRDPLREAKWGCTWCNLVRRSPAASPLPTPLPTPARMALQRWKHFTTPPSEAVRGLAGGLPATPRRPTTPRCPPAPHPTSATGLRPTGRRARAPRLASPRFRLEGRWVPLGSHVRRSAGEAAHEAGAPERCRGRCRGPGAGVGGPTLRLEDPARQVPAGGVSRGRARRPRLARASSPHGGSLRLGPPPPPGCR